MSCRVCNRYDCQGHDLPTPPRASAEERAKKLAVLIDVNHPDHMDLDALKKNIADQIQQAVEDAREAAIIEESFKCYEHSEKARAQGFAKGLRGRRRKRSEKAKPM